MNGLDSYETLRTFRSFPSTELAEFLERKRFSSGGVRQVPKGLEIKFKKMPYPNTNIGMGVLVKKGNSGPTQNGDLLAFIREESIFSPTVDGEMLREDCILREIIEELLCSTRFNYELIKGLAVLNSGGKMQYLNLVTCKLDDVEQYIMSADRLFREYAKVVRQLCRSKRAVED